MLKLRQAKASELVSGLEIVLYQLKIIYVIEKISRHFLNIESKMISHQNKTSEIAIVVIAFNRLESLKRLIGSLYKADYHGDKVDLIISIDNSGSNTLVDYAKSLQWNNGELKIIAHKERLGLKKHVLKCGELTDTYSNICVLEDDLYVSPSFYTFTKVAISHFKNFKDIAGISLYSHQWNPYTNRPFNAIEDRFDVFLLQIASSWGQVWSREGWKDFMTWFIDKNDEDLYSPLLPIAVSNWSKKSWLKFHNKYLVDSNKYFVYPRQSLTTNFSDQGEHANVTSTYQVPLLSNSKSNFNLPGNIEDSIKYDSFFENKNIPNKLLIDSEDLDVNLQSEKNNKKRFILTTKIYNFKIIKSFGMKLRPIDLNVIFEIPGDQIFLYDTKYKCKNTRSSYKYDIQRFIYDLKAETKYEYLASSLYLYYKSLIVKLRKLI